MGFGDKLRNFMYGRYGRDHLNLFLTIVSFILLIIGVFVRAEAAWILLIAALILLTVSYYRMFSRNYAKRYAENQKFLSVIHKITGKRDSFRIRITRTSNVPSAKSSSAFRKERAGYRSTARSAGRISLKTPEKPRPRKAAVFYCHFHTEMSDLTLRIQNKYNRLHGKNGII